MRETEIKILDIKRDALEEKLKALGAEREFEGEIHALYFDDDRSSLKERKDVLRLRKEGQKAVVTFKAHIDSGEAKVREEREISVSDFDTAKEIFEAIGFRTWLEMRKFRTTYAFRGVRFEIDRYMDEYGFIPEFLEIEAGDIETVFRYAEILGFTKGDCRPWDAVQLAEHYRTRK